MAQKTSGSSRSSSSTKKPTSTARKPSSASGRSSGGKSSASTRSAGSKSSTAGKKTAPEKNVPEAVDVRKPVRREVGAVVLLFFALVAFITYFNVDAWLVDIFRDLCHGLFGWGFYIMCPALLLAAGVLGFHKGRPVSGRLVCALLLPMFFGAFVHILFCTREGFFVDDIVSTVSNLWKTGLQGDSRCGGVLAGLVAEGLDYAISVYGGAPVLGIAFVALLCGALRLNAETVSKMMAERPKLSYVPESAYEDDDFEPMDFFDPDKFEKKSAGAKSNFSLFDLDLDDEGPGPETMREKKSAKRSSGKESVLPKEESFRPEDVTAREPKGARGKKNSKRRPDFFDVEKEDELFAQSHAEPAPVMDTKDVEPVSMEQAAAIAGVQLDSAAMDGPAAPKTEKIKVDKDAEAAKVAAEIEAAEEEEKPAYVYPPLTLLAQGKAGKGDARDEIEKNRERLESTIRSFGVNAHIVDVTHGPTVTRFDLELDQGVKLNKLTNLAGDIALSLGVVSVRIAPIPDKISTVGVEVPNRKTTTVYLRDIIASPEFEKATSKISFAIGKDIGGNAIVGNIAKLPHLLIAGTTGSGKSVFINSLILSLLYKSTPDEVRMIMIDPKMVELGIYNGMPHLYVPVVTDPKKAAGALQWSVVEMLKRYRLFSEVGVRDLAGYNSYQRRHGEPTLPQVVIIIDELADLMMVASKEVEESICRVAQMGRASGMHLVIATQRPSADVITGLMKANIPSRIAFAVSSAMESRIIMDQSGAEKLVGWGDMLYAPLGIGKAMRVQGAFVTDEEREKVIEYIKKDAEAACSDEILAEIERAAVDKNDKGGKAAADDAEESLSDAYDELLPQAVEVVLELKQASVSSLQRRLKLGYSRAARIVDQMEELGVVGPYEGSKPRKLLITKQQWQEMQYATGVAPADSIAAEFSDVADDAHFAELLNSEDEDEL